MSNKPKWPQSSKHPKNLNDWDIKIRQGHIKNGACDDEEVHGIPLVSEITSIVHAQAEGDQFHCHLKNEEPIEGVVDYLGHHQCF